MRRCPTEKGIKIFQDLEIYQKNFGKKI